MTIVTTDIVAFIEKRLDEDWTTAMDVPNQRWQDSAGFVETWAGKVGPFQTRPEPVGDMRRMPGAARHAALHDPDRTLRAIDGTRKIVALCAEVIGDRDLGGYGKFGLLRDDPQALAITLAVETLLRIAAEWSRHDDYQQEWRP